MFYKFLTCYFIFLIFGDYKSPAIEVVDCKLRAFDRFLFAKNSLLGEGCGCMCGGGEGFSLINADLHALASGRESHIAIAVFDLSNTPRSESVLKHCLLSFAISLCSNEITQNRLPVYQ